MKTNNTYYLYMAEAEGVYPLVTTHTARLNAIIRDLKNLPYQQIPQSVFSAIVAKYDISLSLADINYITERI
jgi:hypothetical protein